MQGIGNVLWSFTNVATFSERLLESACRETARRAREDPSSASQNIAQVLSAAQAAGLLHVELFEGGDSGFPSWLRLGAFEFEGCTRHRCQRAADPRQRRQARVQRIGRSVDTTEPVPRLAYLSFLASGRTQWRWWLVKDGEPDLRTGLGSPGSVVHGSVSGRCQCGELGGSLHPKLFYICLGQRGSSGLRCRAGKSHTGRNGRSCAPGAAKARKDNST